MAASDTGQNAIRWSRVVAAMLAVLFVLEITSQTVVWAFAGKPFHSLSLYRWSAYGLVRNNPDLTSPAFVINRNGFRATRDYEKEKPPGVFRVMLLGGSVLYSGLVPAVARLSHYGRVRSDQTIAPYLEQRIRQDPAFEGIKVEVINAAVNFNRIIEVSAAYLAEYLHWQPDFVIVFGSVNNFGPTRYHGDLAAGRTSLQQRHNWDPEFQRLVNDHGVASTIERVWRDGAEHSAALALAYKFALIVSDKIVGVSGQFSIGNHFAAEPKGSETASELEAYFRMYASYADAMIAAAHRMGHGMAFAWEPELGDLAGIKPLSTEEQTIFPLLQRTPDAVAQTEASRQLFRRHFAEMGTPIVDPTDPLRSHNETVFIDYTHYTPIGNRVIADIAYEQLRTELVKQLAISKVRRQ
jgi:hypothetical protein